MMKLSPAKITLPVADIESTDRIHPGRLCPLGKHLVKEHESHTSDGKIIEVRAYCAENPSKKDILTIHEIRAMTGEYFYQLSGAPNAGVLKGYKYADVFDAEIRGWTRYWNDIFAIPDPLDANLVKALIASESSFYHQTNTDAKKHGRARGLMQLTDDTMNALSDHHGELKNYLICIEHEELFDPTANICAGVRWLFRKKDTASSKLGRPATWFETVADYKGILKGLPDHPWMDRFQHLYLCTIKGT